MERPSRGIFGAAFLLLDNVIYSPCVSLSRSYELPEAAWSPIKLEMTRVD